MGYTSILGCRPCNSPIFFTRWDLLQLCFLLNAPLFSPQLIKTNRNKNQLLKYFWRMLLWKKNCLYVKFIHTVDSRWFEYLKLESSKSYYLYKLPSKQNYLLSKTYKKSHSITQTIIALNKFLFHPNKFLVPLQIWVIESQL